MKVDCVVFTGVDNVA